MLNFEKEDIRSLLFDGHIGLEKESLRITREGFFAHTPHPFKDDKYIVRDFCENQTEVNTSPEDTAEKAVEQLLFHTRRLKEKLSQMDEPEILWEFSNPPYIRNEEDIPIAVFTGDEQEKTEYRKYLAERYGRYKMTFSGIHFNYSFSEELLRRNARIAGVSDFDRYRNQFYVELAAKAQEYNWIVVAITAASPVMDSSFYEKGGYGIDVFNGMGSTRCSEMGYWNFFTPILDFTNLEMYCKSIRKYVEQGLIRSTAELYFPVRLKPPGAYSIERLAREGVSHIELRMIDLNPLSEAGIDVRDVRFLQMLLIYLGCVDSIDFNADLQMLSIANTKDAARFDLKTVNLTDRLGRRKSIADAAINLIERMHRFFEFADNDVLDILDYQMEKFTERKNRYTWRVKEIYSDSFVEKGLARIQ